MSQPPCQPCQITVVVLDTNIVLDLFVFDDPRYALLRHKLEAGALRWLATQPMRDELERVLTYPHLLARLQAKGQGAAAVLAQFDALSQHAEVAPRAPYICKDADDQKFIDLAAQQQATLYSKDKAVLTMRRRLTKMGAQICSGPA